MGAKDTGPTQHSAARVGKGVLIGCGFMLLAFIMAPSEEEKAEAARAERAKPPAALTMPQALTMCQLALKQLSRDPDTAEVPYVEDFGRAPEFYFAWGVSTRFMRMRNGLGLEVPVSASCTVDANTRRITSMTFDGKTIL